ncbi:pyridoxal-phosphate-dependent aminotransferase family protein [Thermospira aquatica]|uniref:Alanine--glyoxylate aminotransferase family protein n=1 Tax=Thermospira aquatica TaxID=2828656 RepID=A0AAX3BCU4_9SPIR|nr:alanine--glyoxylate aminotransferase family protein [Thermospira aquatica]URA10088.1 alanine--glyoxylate aminotransferase family protein [Thermospira aquatica]
MMKRFLCAPGPTAVPSEVLVEMARPLMHHRTPQFSEVVAENAEMLKKVFKTSSPVLTLTASGTGGMEASITNFMSPGDTIIVLSAGKFGERFAEIGRAYGLNVVELKAEYGKDIKAEEVREALKKYPEAKGVYTEYSETSTAVAFDVKGIASVVRETSAIMVVDGITAIGAMEFEMDEWGVDVAIAGAQKSFMIPPGLAFVAYSSKAEKLMKEAKLPRFYFDLAKERKNLEKKTTAWTPAISLFMGLNVALKMMLEEGMENVIKRHYLVAETFRQAVQAIGLQLFADVPNVRPSDSVTAIRVPEGVDGAKIPAYMRDKYGVTIAGGQGSMKGKIFRLGHLGYVDKSDIVVELQAMELALKELGYTFELGKSVAAAQEYILKNFPVPNVAVSEAGD